MLWHAYALHTVEGPGKVPCRFGAPPPACALALRLLGASGLATPARHESRRRTGENAAHHGCRQVWHLCGDEPGALCLCSRCCTRKPRGYTSQANHLHLGLPRNASILCHSQPQAPPAWPCLGIAAPYRAAFQRSVRRRSAGPLLDRAAGIPHGGASL
jgi:hypothetical protein